MYEFIMFFGPAAITYLVVHCLVRKKNTGSINSLIELVAYAFIDAVFTTVLLYPFEKVDVLTNNVVEPHLIYGVSALIAAGVISVLVGVVISVIQTRINVQMECERTE